MHDFQKKQLPKIIVTFDSAEQIKKAAAKRNNEKMLIEIRDQDLIVKNFVSMRNFIATIHEYYIKINHLRNQYMTEVITKTNLELLSKKQLNSKNLYQ